MTNSLTFRLKLLVPAVLILMLAQGFNASLSITSFEKLYLESLISSYKVVARDFQRNIASAIRFGKSLNKFFGITKLMDEIQKNNPDLAQVNVFAPEGQILYSLDDSNIGEIVPEQLRIDFTPQEYSDSLDESVVLTDNSYHILYPIINRKGEWEGTMDLSFKRELIDNRVGTIIQWNLEVLGWTTLVAAILLAVGLSFLINREGTTAPRMRIYVVLLSILGTAQIFYSLFNVQYFRTNYLEITHQKASILTQLLKDDIEFLLQKNLRINRLVKVDVLMSEIIRSTPEIQDMGILDKEKYLLYLANAQGVANVQKEGDRQQVEMAEHEDSETYELLVPLLKNGTTEGYIWVQLSRKLIGGKIQEIVFDSVTVVVISLLFVMELVIFFLIFISRQIKKPKTGVPPLQGKYGIIRPAAFIVIFAIDLSVSFLPLHVEQLYEPILGLSKNVIMGLPISVNMLFAGIALIIGGIWLDKRGWHEPFVFGVVCASMGAFLCGTATGAVEFIFYRCFTGFGYGLAVMSSQGFIFNNTDFTERARGISNLTAGMYSGSICAGAVGAMLAERMGFSRVFYVATVVILLSAVFVIVFMRDSFGAASQPKQKSKPSSKPSNHPPQKFSDYFKFIANRNVFALLFFSSVPSALCSVGFLYYASPIYLNSINTSQSNIGRALMIYGLFMISLAPFISRYVDRADNKKPYIVLSGLFGGVGLLIFYTVEGFFATLFAILMLGIASSIGFASQTVFALNLKVTQNLGEGKAMGVYRAVERLGQVMGPIVLGTLIAVMGLEHAIALIGGIYLVSSILFWIFATNEGVISNIFRRRWTPKKISPEKNYGYALVAVMSLIAASDGKLKEEERQSAEKMIDETEEIRKYLTVEEARSIFSLYINELLEHKKQGRETFDKAANILLRNIPVVEKDEWKLNVLATATEMAMADGIMHEAERAMISRIGLQLWQSSEAYLTTRTA